MDYKKYLILAIAFVAVGMGGYATGRYVQPAKVVEKINTVEVEKVVTKVQVVEKKVYVKIANTDVRTETNVIKHPDGTEETRTVVTDRSRVEETDTDQSSSNTTVTTDSNIVTQKVTDTSVSKNYHIRVDAGAGARFVGQLTPVLQLGVGFERRIAGPVFGGVWANTTLNLLAPAAPPYTVTGGISLGLEF